MRCMGSAKAARAFLGALQGAPLQLRGRNMFPQVGVGPVAIDDFKAGDLSHYGFLVSV